MSLASFTSRPTHARPLNHVAVSVDNIDAVVAWYTEVMGFQLMGGRILHIKREDDPSAPIFSIYGDSLDEVRLAYMATGGAGGAGFEVFQFVRPAFETPAPGRNSNGFAYNRGGFFHICVTDADPDALAARVVEKGGARVGKTVDLGHGITCLYVKDPWGHVIEVLDVSFERVATKLVV